MGRAGARTATGTRAGPRRRRPRRRARGPSAAEQRLDQRVRGVVVPGPRAEREGREGPAAVHEEARRQRPHAVGVRDVHRRIEQDRERELVVGDERLDLRRDAVHRHGEEHEALVLVVPPQALYRRHLLAARRAPRRPEVDHDDLAPLGGELERGGGGGGGAGGGGGGLGGGAPAAGPAGAASSTRAAGAGRRARTRTTPARPRATAATVTSASLRGIGRLEVYLRRR